MTTSLRARIKAGRRRGTLAVKLFDILRLAATRDGRSTLFTLAAHGDEVHQTTSFTLEDRYPGLFDEARKLAPGAGRILSFGCSTGEELSALRRRFPQAEIIGAEINAHSRRIARRRIAADSKAKVIPPREVDGAFDLVFALAVFQRQPHRADEIGVQDLTYIYPFERFDSTLCSLVDRLRPGGLLFVVNAQYRVEDCSLASNLERVPQVDLDLRPRFNRYGRRAKSLSSGIAFRLARHKTLSEI